MKSIKSFFIPFCPIMGHFTTPFPPFYASPIVDLLKDNYDKFTIFLFFWRTSMEQEEIYRIIAENSSDLIRIIDINGIVQYVSPSHETLLGYDHEELIGKHYQLNTLY